MFDFLNKLSHNHSPPPQHEEVIFEELSSEDEEHQLKRSASQNESFVKQSSKHSSPRKLQTIDPHDRIAKKQLKRGNSIVGKMQQSQKLQLDPSVVSIFQEALALSTKPLSGLLTKNLSKARIDRERKVYIREMARDEEQYLQEAGKATQAQSSYLQQGLESTVFGIIDQISKEIEICDMPIRLRRKKFQDLEEERKLEMMRLIKQRENELQDKIGQLSVQFNLGQQAGRRANEILSKEDFDPDSVKTRMAEEFVREKQRAREELKAKAEEQQERKRLQAEIKRAEEEARAQQARIEKHQRLQREFAEKQLARQEQHEKAKTEELSYRQFLKEYKQLKPLYKKKEEEFQSRLKEEKKERYHLLKEKQARYEPLNMEMLEMHQERYEQLRQEDRERKKAEMDLARQREQLLKKQLDEKIYKGKFRYLVLQEMVDSQAKKRQKEAEKQAILMKKQAYSMQVKQNFKPTVDPAKRQEIQQILNSHKQQRRKFMTPNRVAYSDHYSTISSSQHHPYSEPQADPRKQGERYHRLFKQYIRAKIERGEVKSEQAEEEQRPTPAPNYLKELREKYEGRIPSKSTRLQRQIEQLKEGEDYRALILKAEQFQSKAKQREVKLRNVAHLPKEQAELEQDYLCAIKAKMQLINNMD